MPAINTSLPSQVIKQNITKYLWNYFTVNFNSDQSSTYTITSVYAVLMFKTANLDEIM